MKQKVSQNQSISSRDFGAEVSRAVTVKSYQSKWSEVHEAADMMSEFYENIGKSYFDATGKEGNFLSPRNAAKYLPHNMNLEMLVERPDEFIQITANALGKQYNQIQQLEKPIRDIEELISFKKSEHERIAIPESKEAILNEIKTLEERRHDIETKLHEHIRENEDLHILLEDRAFLKESEEAIKPKFRKLPETEQERKYLAGQILDSYKSQSPQDILMGIFGNQEKGLIRNPAYLKARSVLIDVAEYNGTYGNSVFIDPDITKTAMNYANSMGKIIGFKKAFPEYADGVGFDGIMRTFKGEYDKKRATILEKPHSDIRAKELRKLDKKFSEARKFMEDTYDVYMGHYDTSNPKMRAFSKISRDLVAAAKLGKVPIYQMTELATAIMKQGIVPVMAEGLRPKLLSLNHMLKTSESEDVIKNSADFLIGLNGVQGGLISRMTDSSLMNYAPGVSGITNHIMGGVESLANMSANVFFINQMANINEGIVAGAFQSEVMRACFEFKAGTITPKLKQKMVRYGVNLDRDAEKFITQYKKSGGYKTDTGGYQTKAHAWDDAESAHNLTMSVRRAVKDTIVNKNIFTSPYWSNNSIGKMIFMFHGWAYDAFIHYTLPMLQRPQGEHFLQFAAVVGINMLIPPLARLANGKEAYTDDKTWKNEIYQGLDYSGLLGPYTQMIETLNTLTGGAVLPGMKTERTDQRALLGALGPVFGYANDAYAFTHTMATGRFTEGNLKRGLRLLPFNSSPLVSLPAAAWLNSMNLPKRTNQAAPWSWREALLGEE